MSYLPYPWPILGVILLLPLGLAGQAGSPGAPATNKTIEKKADTSKTDSLVQAPATPAAPEKGSPSAGKTAPPGPAVAPGSAPGGAQNNASTQSSMRTTMEGVAQKQRDTTLAAMQASVSKQRASSAVASARQDLSPIKPMLSSAGASFFMLPALAPPESAASAGFSLPEATIADVDCQPVPETQVAPVLEEAARREGIEANLLTAVVQQESGYRPCAISQKGAQGLMQLMPDTAQKFGLTDPFDIKQNIDAGAKYLKELITRYGGKLDLALAAYNAGPDKVDAAGGIPAIPETTAYVSEILGKVGLPAAGPTPPVTVIPPVQ